MSKVEVFIRLNEIVIFLRKGLATLTEINEHLENKSTVNRLNLCRHPRTFRRDCDDILQIYQISIDYDRSTGNYYINEEGQTSLNERKLEAFDILHALNVHESTAQYIHLEKRRPQGTKNIFLLLNAIQDQCQVKFFYQGYWSDGPTNTPALRFSTRY